MARTAQALYDACRDVHGRVDVRVEAGSLHPNPLEDLYRKRLAGLPPVPQDQKRQYAYGTTEKTMNDQCCGTPETSEQAADRLREQLKAAEKQAACERKAHKKAARLERQRKADRNLAIDTFADVASDPGANPIARVEAAKNLIQITGSY